MFTLKPLSAAVMASLLAAPAHAQTPDLDWASMQLEPATITAAGPRRISSAA